MKHNPSFSEDSGDFHPSSDINVTPLVDVMLVLLVIFMITAPMLTSGMKIDLPKSSDAAPLDVGEPIVISVNRNNTVAVGNEIVSRQDVAATVLRQLAGDKTRAMQLRGDTLADYGDIVFVLGEMSKNGITKIAIETAPNPKK